MLWNGGVVKRGGMGTNVRARETLDPCATQPLHRNFGCRLCAMLCGAVAGSYGSYITMNGVV